MFSYFSFWFSTSKGDKSLPLDANHDIAFASTECSRHLRVLRQFAHGLPRQVGNLSPCAGAIPPAREQLFASILKCSSEAESNPLHKTVENAARNGNNPAELSRPAPMFAGGPARFRVPPAEHSMCQQTRSVPSPSDRRPYE